MNEHSSVPQPGGATCPNCGAAQNAGVAVCAECGAVLRPARSGKGWALAGKILVGFLLFMGALILAASGLAVSAIPLMNGYSSVASEAQAVSQAASQANFFYGLAALSAVLGVAWIAFWATRRK